MDLTELRENFPYLNSGKIYFNHAATSPLSKRISNKLSDYLIERGSGKIDNYPNWLDAANQTKQMLAELINATNDRIAFTDNTSNGINILARGLNLKNGDEIILNDVEFPSNVYPFLNLQQKGVKVRFAKSDKFIVTAEKILSCVTGKTKIISVSAVQFLSGYRTELKKIGEYCRDKNIVFCVDGIQALGAVNIDVEEYKIDFLASGTQKWLMGAMGFAFIYIRKEIQDKIIQSNVGWLSVNDAWNLLDYRMDLKSSASRFQTGTISMFGVYALNESLKLLFEFGKNNAEDRILNNSKYFLQKLIGAGFHPLLENFDDEYLSGIVSFKHHKAEDLFNYLSSQNIICAVREGVVRFSPHYYNTRSEIDAVVAALKKYFNR